MYAETHEVPRGIAPLSNPAPKLGRNVAISALGVLGALVYLGFLLNVFTYHFAAVAGMISSTTLCASAYLLYRAVNSKNYGYQFDPERGTLEFWTIGQPENRANLLDKENWKRMLSRRRISLSAILAARTSHTRIFDDASRQWQYIYHLELQGTFGSIPFSFTTEEKRDAFAAYVQRHSQLGIDVH